VGDMGLLMGEGCGWACPGGGFAVFKVVIGAFSMIISVNPDFAYP